MSDPSAITRPLLDLDDLRVDIDGVPACDGLGFRTTGERVLVLGAPRALFDAAVGIAPIVRGRLRVRGVAASLATRQGVIAGAALDPPTPPRWSVTDYVRWSARLGGVPEVLARASAEDAIRKLELGPLAGSQLGRLVPHARRATIVAAALATYAEVIALEDPLGGLADDARAAYARVLLKALEDRAWIVFAPRVPLSSELGLAADEVVIGSASRVDVQGAPAAIASNQRRFVGRVRGKAAAIAPILLARGAKVEDRGSHVLFDLGAEMTTSELASICAGANVAIVELVPALEALS